MSEATTCITFDQNTCPALVFFLNCKCVQVHTLQNSIADQRGTVAVKYGRGRLWFFGEEGGGSREEGGVKVERKMAMMMMMMIKWRWMSWRGGWGQGGEEDGGNIVKDDQGSRKWESRLDYTFQLSWLQKQPWHASILMWHRPGQQPLVPALDDDDDDDDDY